MADNFAISVKGVSKNFQLPHEKVDSLKSVFINPFRYRKGIEVQHALKDISFDVKKGEFLGIVGRNGSGKSTLLKIIAGIYRPSIGSVAINGRLVPFIELGVGFNPDLTGRENVFLNGALMGFSLKEIRGKYSDIVEFAELERFMDQKLKNYSSGMQVRLAFSVATVLAESDILLIDEVLAVGDADFQKKCFEYFKSLKKNNKTVIFVSHDMNAVREYCDRAILINESKIIATGTPGKVSREYDKLFIQESPQQPSDPRKERRGTGEITYTHVDVERREILTDDTNFVLRTKTKVLQDVEDAIFGFSIKNSADVLILGNNTKLEGRKFENLKKGEIIEIDWIIPSILGDGEYFANVAVESSIAVFYDWWGEATKFSVRRNTPMGLAAHPKMGLTIKRGDKS